MTEKRSCSGTTGKSDPAGGSDLASDSEKGERIAMCQHPDGNGEYVPAEEITDGRCFDGHCNCTPAIFVREATFTEEEQ